VRTNSTLVRIGVGLCLGIALSATAAFGVVPPAVDWARFYGDSLSTSGSSVAQRHGGGFLAAGWMKPGRYMGLRGFLVATDSQGDVEWARSLSPAHATAEFSTVRATEDHGFILGGAVRDTAVRVGPLMYAVKVDSMGNREWEDVFYQDTEAICYSAVQCSDGGYALLGVVSGARPNSGYKLYKTDAAGALEWSQLYQENVGKDASVPDHAPLQQTSDGGYFIGARKDSSGAWLLKTDSLGAVEWQRTYVGQLAADVRSLQQTDDGGYIVTGAGASSWLSPNGSDVYLMKLNSEGDVNWRRTYGGEKEDCGEAVAELPDGGYVVAGLTGSFEAEGMDGYVVRTNSEGALQWSRTFGGYGHEAYALEPTSDGGSILVCRAYNPLVRHSQLELVKLGAEGQ